ncbi:hypothetical protein QP794_27085 [Paenibacillus sp. UMB7766-LJ446]|uniref:hypothetical protein n=1 Tax=Paenibacillus sp. UMB7766-LJ446 TaxID=3046313 RepID=UPI0025500D79|nr:hypothetical protein [Paenibacillus sp. UMB7766-LJ446]MDK8193753.1 hypothetical protein [Paenibacillus sp. UMB7766-LJ446]
MLKTNGVMKNAADRILRQAVGMSHNQKFVVPNSMERYTKRQLQDISSGILNYKNSIGNGGGSDSTMRRLYPRLAAWAGIK